MKKCIIIFSIFLLNPIINGVNKSSSFSFIETNTFVPLSQNDNIDGIRSTNDDIVEEPNYHIGNLELNENVGGELSYLNPYCFYKFTSNEKQITRLNLYHNFVYNRGVTCDVYKKLGNNDYYMHLFSYDSSTDDNSSDFPEVPYFPGETFLYRLRDKDGVNVRFSILGYFEKIENTNCVSFDYNTGYFKTFNFNLSEERNVPKQNPIGQPNNPHQDLRNTIQNTTISPYKNIGKFRTYISKFDESEKTFVTGNVNVGSGFLLNSNVVGTAAHCVISGMYKYSHNSDLTENEVCYGVWPSRPNIDLGLSGNYLHYPTITPLKAYFSLNYYFKSGDDYRNFDWAFLLINPSQSYGNFFNIYPDDGTANTLSLFSTAIANGYPSNGINSGKTQYERNVTYFSRESKYIFQYYANVTGGQSGGPLYIKFNNIYYVIGILTGNNASGINFSVNYNSSLLNLFNFIKNGG